MSTLFAYGTLEFPEILEIVAGRRYAALQPAVADGYRRRLLVGRLYPGLFPDASECTEGVLYRELDAEAMRRVDHFEDDLYLRRSIAVRGPDGQPVLAEAYIVKPEHRGALSAEAWDREAFRETHLSDFLIRCRAFAQTLVASEAPR